MASLADIGLWAAAGALLLGGLTLAAWGIRGDRARGRRRCPRCWYEIGAGKGMTCPECGRTQPRERRFARARRRKWAILVGVLLVLLSPGPEMGRRVREGGWMSVTPRIVHIAMMPWLDESGLWFTMGNAQSLDFLGGEDYRGPRRWSDDGKSQWERLEARTAVWAARRGIRSATNGKQTWGASVLGSFPDTMTDADAARLMELRNSPYLGVRQSAMSTLSVWRRSEVLPEIRDLIVSMHRNDQMLGCLYLFAWCRGEFFSYIIPEVENVPEEARLLLVETEGLVDAVCFHVVNTQDETYKAIWTSLLRPLGPLPQVTETLWAVAMYDGSATAIEAAAILVEWGLGDDGLASRLKEVAIAGETHWRMNAISVLCDMDIKYGELGWLILQPEMQGSQRDWQSLVEALMNPKLSPECKAALCEAMAADQRYAAHLEPLIRHLGGPTAKTLQGLKDVRDSPLTTRGKSWDDLCALIVRIEQGELGKVPGGEP